MESGLPPGQHEPREFHLPGRSAQRWTDRLCIQRGDILFCLGFSVNAESV